MALSLSVNGSSFSYPEVDDVAWGANATEWAQAVTAVITNMRAPSSPVASAGKVRLGNLDPIAWRNAGNTGDYSLYVDASGDLIYTDGVTPINISAAGGGNVVGPGSSTDNAIARFDGATGQLLQNSTVLMGDTGAITGVLSLALTNVDTWTFSPDGSGAFALANNSTDRLKLDGSGVLTLLNPTTIAGSTLRIDQQDDPAGDASLSLRVNVDSTPVEAMVYVDNSDSDKLKIDYEGTTQLTIDGSTVDVKDTLRIDGTGVGDAKLTLRVNSDDANSWDIYNDNDNGDILSFAYNDYKLCELVAYADGNNSQLVLDANTGDSLIRFRVNNDNANAWVIRNDNSDSDRLVFQYNDTDYVAFNAAGNGGLKLHNANIASGSTPASNTLYANLIPKAWAIVDSSGTLQDGVNLSASNPASGQFDFSFLTDMASANYAVVAMAAYTGDATSKVICVYTSLATTGFTVYTRESDAVDTALEPSTFAVIVLGDQ